MDDRHSTSFCDSSRTALVDAGDYFRETLRRLPLADAVLHLLRFALDDRFLSACFERHRGHGYEDILSFPRLVELLIEALLVQHGSARQALLAAADAVCGLRSRENSRAADRRWYPVPRR